MRITMPDGRVFQGTAVQIVQAMQSVTFDRRDATVDEYIQWTVDNAARLHDVALEVRGDSTEERAESLVSELIRTGLARG